MFINNFDPVAFTIKTLLNRNVCDVELGVGDVCNHFHLNFLYLVNIGNSIPESKFSVPLFSIVIAASLNSIKRITSQNCYHKDAYPNCCEAKNCLQCSYIHVSSKLIILHVASLQPPLHRLLQYIQNAGVHL